MVKLFAKKKSEEIKEIKDVVNPVNEVIVKNKPKKIKAKKEKKEGKGEQEFGEPEYAKEVRKPKIKVTKVSDKQYPTLKLINESEIALDFATKAYDRFNKLVKSIVLFGSSAKRTAVAGSDVDIIIIIDDCTIQWDQELIAWYREELGKLIQKNPYQKSLHINSVKLSTWWQDMIKGDPVVVNVIRYGESLIDFGGFFSPLKVLLQNGAIKSTPESIYTALQRAPAHMARSKAAILGAVEGLYWACVDSSHAALIAAKQLPPSPEHVPDMLRDNFVARKMLDMKYVMWYKELYALTHKILRGEITAVPGKDVDIWQSRTDEFVRVMAQLVKKFI